MHRAEAATVPGGYRSESHRPSIQTHVTHSCARVRDSHRARLVCCGQLIPFYGGNIQHFCSYVTPPENAAYLYARKHKHKRVIIEQRNNKGFLFFFGVGGVKFQKKIHSITVRMEAGVLKYPLKVASFKSLFSYKHCPA